MKNIKFLLIILYFPLLNSCVSTFEPYHFREVIGITHAGDTVVIDVNSLRPKIYNSYQYNNTHLPYYNNIPYHPQVIIRPIRPVVRPTTPVTPPTPPKPIIVRPNISVPTISNKSLKNNN